MARSKKLKMRGVIEIASTNPYNFPFPSLQTVARQFARMNKSELGTVTVIPLRNDEYNLLFENGFTRGELKRTFGEPHLPVPYNRSRHAFQMDRSRRDSCTYSIRLFTEVGEDVSSRLKARVEFCRPYLETVIRKDPRAPGFPGQPMPRYGKPSMTVERLDSNREYWFMAPVKSAKPAKAK